MTPLHPDFQKILDQFIKRYGKEEGERLFWAWVNKMGLNPDKPYRMPQEKFSWAKSVLQLVRQDAEAKYYKVEALFPLVSMNRNVYTEDELLRAARTLIGKPVNLNHTDRVLDGVEVVDAEYEDGAVEVLLRVPKDLEVDGRHLVDLIDSGEILHVSIEASCRQVTPTVMGREVGRKCEGLLFTGLALLSKDVLPGIPLTRIVPAEAIVEAYGEECLSKDKLEIRDVKRSKEKGEASEAEWTTAFINRLPDAAFAVIEPAYKRGETEDKRCRHLPHHGPDVKDPDEHSSVDLPHLRNALARMNQIKPITDSISTEELRERARRHLMRHAKALLKTYQETFTGEEKTAIILDWLEDIDVRLELIEEYVKNARGERAGLKDELKVEEKVAEEPPKETEKAEEEQVEEKPCILTREGFWRRFRELRSEGLSKSEAYRLTVFEFIRALEELLSQSSQDAP
ncbi:hypothetical protein J7L06_00520 [Candidatus Bathyarchaeota archaeon]|nr:hypothetical protein [Candidatus Bathyarchaeota archaeon]